ncbi:MAG: hypothetical protein E7396_06710 [Ruminococcaceae bacterium]|nr:hypothetical protein [Oscillospiraceae bacterium]
MKKLLSLALVLTMLFTIIAVPSVSAATETTILAKADIESNTGTWSAYAVSGPDAGTGGTKSTEKTRIASHTATSATVNGNTYTVSSSMTNVTVATAAQTHPAVATGMNSNANILKLTQTGNTSILRLYTADGALDIQAGDTVTVHFKMLLTDFYDHPQYKDGTTEEVVMPSAITAPATYSWKPGYMSNIGGTRKATTKNIATEQWTDVDLTYSVTESNLATYKSMFGLSVEGLAVKASGSDFYKTSFPGTVYIAEAWISRTREVSSNNITVTKLGEGTVTGDGEIISGSAATLTATPASGYHFAGWYEKTASNADANCYSKDATYTFTPSSDVNIVAVFEKDAVDGWIELTGSEFDGSTPPNTNLWGKTDAWKNVDTLQSVTTYAAENIEAPDASCGTGVLKIDRSKQATSVTGMVDGRIGYYPGYEVRFEQGQKYRVSYWIYVVSTDKGAEAGETIPFSWGPMKKTSADTHNDTLEVGKWVKKSYEYVADSSWDNLYTALRLSPANITATDTTAYDNGAYDSLNLAYVDSVKFERFDGETVSAEAENGVVYGTGEYAKGDSVTLNAGPEAGYKFVGYYNKDTDELITAEPSYTFTVTGDTTVVAKFAERDAAVYDRNVLYHYGSETGDVGRHNNWCFYDKNNDGELTTTTADQDSSATYNMEVSYKEAAADGIFVPNDDPTFGDTLYMQKNLDKKLHSTVQGRFRAWENGEIVNDKTITEPTEASGKYVVGKKYRFTWWVYPVSMQLENGETAQPETTRITVRHDDGQNTGVENTFTVNVGEWNMLDWTFTANDKMALYAPGIRYSWAYTSNQTTGLSTVVNWVYYDNIQVSEITEWNWGDATEPSNAWFRYNDQASLTANKDASNNINASSVVTYADAGIEPSSDNAGTHVVKMNYKAPNYTEEEFNKDVEAGDVTGDYAGKTYAEAYEYLTRYENAGTGVGMRFKNIVAKNTLGVGETYKISCMLYIDKKVNLATGEADNSNTSVNFIGAASGETLNTDGKNVSFSVPVGKWTEVGYTFKVTEEGLADAQSFYLKLNGLGYKNGEGKLTEVFYVDEVKVERVYVNDLNLEIAEDDTNVTATATVYDIKDGNTVDAIVIIAGYDTDGKLVSVSFSNNGASTALAVGDTLDATYTKADTVDSYVAFLWNDLTNIRPYTMPKTLGE